MKNCRMCENELELESPDGLCSKCHLELCDIEAEKCGRCVKIAKAFVKWLDLADEFEI